MVITKIIGGLGNQLFQYAAGKSIALHHDTKLKLDLTAFNDYKLRNFSLDQFSISYEIAEGTEIKNFTERNLIDKLRDQSSVLSTKRFYREKHFHFDKKFFKYPSNVYLKGYWQSEKYFLPVADIIRKEFTVRQEHINNVSVLAKELNEVESVSVHIRRGDYTNPAVLEMHGILSSSYYQQAIDKISNQYPKSVFYIFSDDMNWVKENLKIKNIVYVSRELTETAIEDFYLFTRCKHNIIANSSFSWWGAWLNTNPEKIVIAPERWFNKKPTDTQDLIPPGWIKF